MAGLSFSLAGAVQFCNYVLVTTPILQNRWCPGQWVRPLSSGLCSSVCPGLSGVPSLSKPAPSNTSPWAVLTHGFLTEQYLEHHCLAPEVTVPQKNIPSMPILAINQLHCHFQAQSFTSSIYKCLFLSSLKKGGEHFSVLGEKWLRCRWFCKMRDIHEG